MAKTYLKSSLGGYFFDVNFKETYSFTNEITQHPVQSGANINDHVYQQPVQITFDVGVSDCLSSYKAGQFTTYPSRAASAFDILYTLWNKAISFSIYAVFGDKPFQFSSMLIKSISTTKDKSTMNALRATVICQQVIIVNAVDVEAVQVADPVDWQKINETNGVYGLTPEIQEKINKYLQGGTGNSILDKIMNALARISLS